MGASPHRPESALRHWAFASPSVVILYFTAVQFSSPGQLREQFHKNRSSKLLSVPLPSRPGRHGPATALHVLSTPRHCLHTCHPWGVSSLRLARLAMQRACSGDAGGLRRDIAAAAHTHKSSGSPGPPCSGDWSMIY
eukprot:scaffold991_cov71-Phaeocystis_antarctica.AAC.1